MEKNVLAGDRLLVNKFLYAPRGGPLGAAPAGRGPCGGATSWSFASRRTRARDFIKRVVGLPGETVGIRDRIVYDRRPAALSEPYVFHADDRVWPDDPNVPEERRRGISSRRRGPGGLLLRAGRQPRRLERQPGVGAGARSET